MTAFLRRFDRFATLTDADVALLERIMVVQQLPAGHVMVREGDAARAPTAAAWLLLDGTVSVAARAPEGGWGVTRTLKPGSFVGLLSLLADLPRSATCTTDGAVTVARLDRATFDALMRKDAGLHSRFQLIVARQLAADVRDLGEKMAEAVRSGTAPAPRS